MNKKIFSIIIVFILLGLSIVIYTEMIPDDYVPKDDEIAINIKLDTKEDIGLIIFDYIVDNHEYSGGISNANKSLIKRNSNNIIVWNKQELNTNSDTVEIMIQFRIITEYVYPNFENIYPASISKNINPISWKANFNESYYISITGDKENGYEALLIDK